MESIKLLLLFIIDIIRNERKLNDDIDNNYSISSDVCSKLIETTKVPVIVNGKDNIPKEGSVLITPNHTSFYDIIALLSCIDRTVTFAAAKELMKYPVLRKYIKAIECVLIDRQTEDAKLMRKQLEDMENAINSTGLILFPEGECSYLDGDIKEFKKGGFIAANKNNTPIVPTYIDIKSMKKIGKWLIPEDEVTITFGEPFTAREVFEGRSNAKELSQYTRDKVLELKNIQ